MKWIIAIIVGLFLSSTLYLTWIEPKKAELAIEQRKTNKIGQQYPQKIKKKSHQTTRINQIIQQELKLHHCLVKNLSTALGNSMNFTLLATYPSIIHFLSLIEENNCYYLSINTEKKTTLLQLKATCKND